MITVTFLEADKEGDIILIKANEFLPEFRVISGRKVLQGKKISILIMKNNDAIFQNDRLLLWKSEIKSFEEQ